MRYQVVSVIDPEPTCGNDAPSPDPGIQEACNDMAGRGFVLVSMFETVRSVGCTCCSCVKCPKKATCLVFASP